MTLCGANTVAASRNPWSGDGLPLPARSNHARDVTAALLRDRFRTDRPRTAPRPPALSRASEATHIAETRDVRVAVLPTQRRSAWPPLCHAYARERAIPRWRCDGPALTLPDESYVAVGIVRSVAAR